MVTDVNGVAAGKRREGMKRRSVQASAQFLTAGSGGIARCARLTILALSGEADVRALAVEDRDTTRVGAITTEAFAGSRLAFVAANALGALRRDWLIYDFAGTARAHAPLAPLSRPYAVWAHGWEIWPGNLRDDYAKALRAASAVFVNSEHTRGRLAQSLPDLTRVYCCPLGTEKDRDGSEAPPALASRERMVLFVGRNDDMFAKGQDVLIDAWPEVVARVPDAVLCFAGGGSHLRRLAELAAASPAAASIRVLGQLSEEEVAALHRRARLFAMLSVVEGFGLVFVEAMSHGVPVLTSTEDASPELNQEGATGYSVSRGDRAAIVDRVVSVLQQDRLFESLSRQAHERWRDNYAFSAFRGRFLTAAAKAGLL
jgi:phosphatidylinositol alpha-1,6-mannosyltransferase